MTLSEGGLDGTYIFGQLHFHWGENDTFGSEHTLDNYQYPFEVTMHDIFEASYSVVI